MHIPSKHMSETVEESMQEEGKKALKHPPRPSGPMIKIVINTGPQIEKAAPIPPRPMKAKKAMKAKHKRKAAGASGPMEDALRAVY